MLHKEKPARASGDVCLRNNLTPRRAGQVAGCTIRTRNSGTSELLASRVEAGQRLEPNRSPHNTHCFVGSNPGLSCPFCCYMVDEPAAIFSE